MPTGGFDAFGQRFYTVGADVVDALLSILYSFLGWLPNIIGALIIILIGASVAQFVKSVFGKLFKTARVEHVANKFGVNKLIQTGGIKTSVTEMLLGLIYWLVMLVFLSTAADVLGVDSITSFIDKLIGYLPAIFAGLIIMVIGVVAAEKISQILGNVEYGKSYKNVVRWLILVVAFITAVQQLGINLDFVTNNLTVLLGGVALAGALAFGLGGKEKAKAFLDKHLG